MKVADMHCDTISEIYKRRKKGEEISLRSSLLHVDLEKMRRGDYGIQNFALYTSLEREKEPFEYAMLLVDTFYEDIEKNQDLIGAVRSWADIEANWKQGRMSAMLTLEEGGVCQGRLEYLRDFYRLGVRMLTLTWNFPNELGFPNHINRGGAAIMGTPDTENGLTETGICFVEEMERLGMIVDVSHLSDAGFRDVLAHTTKPFVASHSNARALVPCCPRDLTDDMIRQLGERGGVAGINYCTDFLRSPDSWGPGETKQSRTEDMVRHMKHMKQVGGIGCIGLGSDFDGIGGCLEIRDASCMPLLEREMRRQGFRESEIEAVFYKNVLRVYKEVLK